MDFTQFMQSTFDFFGNAWEFIVSGGLVAGAIKVFSVANGIKKTLPQETQDAMDTKLSTFKEEMTAQFQEIKSSDSAITISNLKKDVLDCVLKAQSGVVDNPNQWLELAREKQAILKEQYGILIEIPSNVETI